MDTNEALRQRALRLVTLGCSQKIMAAKMGMQASTLSRWLNQKGIAPVSVTALDGFNQYVQELRDALSDLDGNRQSDVSGSDTPPRAVAESPRQPSGHAFATPDVARGQGGALPGPAARLSAEFERATREEERRTTRTPGRPAAAPRKKAAGGRTRAPKPRR